MLWEIKCVRKQWIQGPIYEYNAEIRVHVMNKTTLAMLERIQTRVCKYALGVGRPTPTTAVLGELGR